MAKTISRVMCVLMVMMMVFTFIAPITAYAITGTVVLAENEIEEIQKAIGKGMGNSDDSGSSELTVIGGKKIYTLLKYESNKILVDSEAFSKGKKKDVTKKMTLFVNQLKNSNIADDRQQAIMNEIQSTDSAVAAIMLPLIFEGTKGDLFQAYKIMGPFLDMLNIILGIGAVILIMLVLFSSVMDLAYIGLPVWREAQSGKEGGGKNPFGVSYEAITTVKEVEKGLGGGDYKNAYILYFKRRALTYVVLAICIMYLIGGGLSGVISFILNLVSGITG